MMQSSWVLTGNFKINPSLFIYVPPRCDPHGWAPHVCFFDSVVAAATAELGFLLEHENATIEYTMTATRAPLAAGSTIKRHPNLKLVYVASPASDCT